MDAMTRKDFPHLHHEKTRHGKWVWYVRVDHGPRIRLKEPFGTKEFRAEYNQALVSGSPSKEDGKPNGRETLGWLIKEFMKSGDWTKLAKETRKQLSYQLLKVDKSIGGKPYAASTKAHILAGQDRRREKPSDANKFLKAMRKLFKFAVDRGHMRRNPTDDIAFLKLPNREIGFHTWTEDEIAKFEEYWPLGTRERLAFDIFMYTGLRRGDAVILGKQHIKDGVATIRAAKNGEMVIIPILPPLRASIEAAHTGDLTLLVTAYGKPFDKAGFGNWFRHSCKEAGVPGSAHGLRKAGAVRLAEGGASEPHMNAMFGWRDGSKESATYIRRARRANMAKKSAKLLLLGKKPKKSPHHSPAPKSGSNTGGKSDG
jgi:integrase